jgi:hypothetical protein
MWRDLWRCDDRSRRNYWIRTNLLLIPTVLVSGVTEFGIGEIDIFGRDKEGLGEAFGMHSTEIPFWNFIFGLDLELDFEIGISMFFTRLYLHYPCKGVLYNNQHYFLSSCLARRIPSCFMIVRVK